MSADASDLINIKYTKMFVSDKKARSRRKFCGSAPSQTRITMSEKRSDAIRLNRR